MHAGLGVRRIYEVDIGAVDEERMELSGGFLDELLALAPAWLSDVMDEAPLRRG